MDRDTSHPLLRPIAVAPCLVALAAAVSWWFADRGLPNPDEGAVLTAAARILRGDVFYRDIDAYWMPGSAYVLAGGFALLGEHLSVARGLAAALFCGTTLALYAAALRLVDRPRAALFALSVLSFKFLAWPAFTAYLYSDFAFGFGCAAIALLLHAADGAMRGRVALAGACVGLAFTSKQNLGIYLGAAAIAWLVFPGAVHGARRSAAERRGDLAAFAGGAVAVVGPVLAYFAAHGVLPRLVRSALLRPFTDYVGTSGIPFTTPLRWWELGALRGNEAIPYFPHRFWHMLMQGQLPGWDHYIAFWTAGEVASRALYTSVPLAFGWAIARRFRASPNGDRRGNPVTGFALLAGAVVLSAFPRADWFHVTSVYPVVALLLFALAAPSGPRTRRPWAEAAFVTALLALCGALAGQHHVHLTHRLALERADVFVPPADAWVAPVLASVAEEIPEGEPFFVYGHEAHYYFLSGRFSPWPFSQLYPGQAGGDRGRGLAELLSRNPPPVVVRGLESWAGIPELGSYAPDLVEWMRASYARDEGFFDERPLAGDEPPAWVASVLRPRVDRAPGNPPAAAPEGR